MPLTPAEKQRRYRERRKNNPEKEAEVKRKDLEWYHLPCLNSPVPIGQNVSRDYLRIATTRLSASRGNTPSSTTSSTVRGRKQVKRNRSKLFRDNTKLKEQLEAVNKKHEKYKKRYNREKHKKENKNSSRENRKNEILSNAIKER